MRVDRNMNGNDRSLVYVLGGFIVLLDEMDQASHGGQPGESKVDACIVPKQDRPAILFS